MLSLESIKSLLWVWTFKEVCVCVPLKKCGYGPLKKCVCVCVCVPLKKCVCATTLVTLGWIAKSPFAHNLLYSQQKEILFSNTGLSRRLEINVHEPIRTYLIPVWAHLL